MAVGRNAEVFDPLSLCVAQGSPARRGHFALQRCKRRILPTRASAPGDLGQGQALQALQAPQGSQGEKMLIGFRASDQRQRTKDIRRSAARTTESLSWQTLTPYQGADQSCPDPRAERLSQNRRSDSSVYQQIWRVVCRAALLGAMVRVVLT